MVLMLKIQTYVFDLHNRNIWPTATQQKHMVRNIWSHTIETYGQKHMVTHNRNIWSTAKQQKHMVHSQTIETYGRHAWPILLLALQAAFIPLLTLSASGVSAQLYQQFKKSETIHGNNYNCTGFLILIITGFYSFPHRIRNIFRFKKIKTRFL